MTDPSEGASAAHSRSGDDVTEAVAQAERGTSVQEVHDQPERNKPGQAPVEQAAGDPAMTQGQIVQDTGSGGGGEAGPETASSGAAQSQRGARESDKAAAGED